MKEQKTFPSLELLVTCSAQSPAWPDGLQGKAPATSPTSQTFGIWLDHGPGNRLCGRNGGQVGFEHSLFFPEISLTYLQTPDDNVASSGRCCS